MKFKVWKGQLRVEADYRKALDVLCDIFESIAKSSGSDQEKYRAKMLNFQNSHAFNKYIESTVRRMVTPISVANMRTWRLASKKSTKGKLIYDLLTKEVNVNNNYIFEDQIRENVGLIKTLPQDVANKVVRDIVDEAIKGKRARTIETIIREQTSKHARASARLIARTEVSKTTTAITKARSEALDLKWYVWRTALDGDRVRKSHRNMEDVLVAWSNPPSPEKLVGEKDVGNYHAGNIWNCRCYPEPLIDIDDVKWPHKVYYQERIQRMTKTQFEQLM